MNSSVVFSILIFFVTSLESISFHVNNVDTSTSISGEPFNNITHCTNSHHISPSNIHVLMMGSDKYLQDYQLQVRSFQEYCKLHGYNFHTRDADVVLKKVGTIQSDGGRVHQAVVSSKPLFIHYYMRELFHKYGCEAKWLFFVDADSVMVDLTRSLESIISFANHQYYPAGGGEGCEVVAQLSSSTINTGVIFFRISPAGDKLVRTWISTYMKNQAMGRKWQDEQGWFQYTYLNHLRRLYDIQWPLDCAALSAHFISVPENSIRGQCFASLLYLTGLMPMAGRPHILYQPHKVNSILNGNRNSGSSDSNGKGVRFCVMAGLTPEDRFNTHDWASELWKSPSLSPLRMRTSSQRQEDELNQVMITYIISGKTTTVVRSSCPIDHVLLFHGRDEATLTFLQRTFDRNLQRAKKLMALAAESKLVFRYANGSEAGAHPPGGSQRVTSFHLFQCDDNGVCIVPPHSSSSGGDGSSSIGSHMTVHSDRSCERDVAAALGTSGSNLEWIAGNHLPKEVEELAKKLEQNRLQILG